MNKNFISGVGLGLRRDLATALLNCGDITPDFVEFAPENWMNLGGHWGKTIKAVVERYPITCHGLSLSLGSPEELDWEFLKQLKSFFAEVPVQLFSEHLSYCKCDNAHLYDLLPMPFRADAVHHVSNRIKQVQDFLGRQIAIENVSYYTTIAPEMSEPDFINAVVKESGCLLLLDVNNVYVNAFNHRYDAKDFIKKLPLNKVAGIHIAGHEKKAEDLIIDTHGQAVIDPVFELLDWTLPYINPVPVLLERDFNFPKFAELQAELARLKNITTQHWTVQNAA